MQIIDARDLAEWTVRCCEHKVYGMFNATGPAGRFTVGQMVEGIRSTLGANASFVHVLQRVPCGAGASGARLVRPAGVDRARRRLRRVHAAEHRPRARRGLTFRPFPDTVRETMAFYAQQTDERKAQLRAGLPADREARVIAAWKARNTALL